MILRMVLEVSNYSQGCLEPVCKRQFSHHLQLLAHFLPLFNFLFSTGCCEQTTALLRQ